MACTTILVGKKASYDGSTMIARNDDGHYDVKKLITVLPKDQPRKYKSINFKNLWDVDSYFICSTYFFRVLYDK